jgi:hypothetical protein
MCDMHGSRVAHEASVGPWLQVAAANGEVIITNDGATILNKMTVTQPAAKMLVELAKSQASGFAQPAAAETPAPCTHQNHPQCSMVFSCA